MCFVLGSHFGAIIPTRTEHRESTLTEFPHKFGLPQIEPGDAITEFGLMKLNAELLLFRHVSGVKTGTSSAILSNIEWTECDHLGSDGTN